MRQLLTTESGSVYEVDHDLGFWRKNNDEFQRAWVGPTVVSGDLPQPNGWEELHDLLDTHGRAVTEVHVGERVYLSGRESWAFSTVIVKVENVESKPAKEEA